MTPFISLSEILEIRISSSSWPDRRKDGISVLRRADMSLDSLDCRGVKLLYSVGGGSVLSGLSQDVFVGVCAHLGAATGEDVLASQEFSHLNNSPS
jgi:hypothetical protein